MTRHFQTLLVALAAATIAQPRVAAGQQEPTMRRIFSSDSIGPVMTQLSPDGKWIAMRVSQRVGTAGSIWLGPSNGNTAMRLTSEGFDDRLPVWFASGDRLAFVTTRFNRNGGQQLFVAVQAIDPATGRAAGAPRQVTTEPVARSGQPSPDGRWVPYVNTGTPPLLRIVPANGGAARTLARLDGPIAGLVFGPDSRHLYYQQIGGTPGAMQFTLKRVAITGDASPEIIARAEHPLRAFPADPRYVIHEVSPEPVRYELRTIGGELVAGITLPRGMNSPTWSADGWGIMGLERNWKGSVNVVSIDGGTPRVLVSGGKHWPEAWTPDGSAVITDRPDGDGVVFETVSMTGTVARSVRLPAGTMQSGWHSSIGPWMSFRVRSPDGTTDVLSAVNVNTGERREISRTAVRVSIRGRGGYEQDGGRWIYVQRDPRTTQLELRSVDPATGQSAPILTLPAEHQFGPGVVLSVHGNRVAYTQARGDSVDLYLVDGPNGRPAKIASFSKDGDTITWSWDGSRIAVADWLPGAPRRGGVHVVSLGTGASGARPIRRYDLGVENGCDTFTWTPDDSQIVMLCYGTNPRIMKLALRDGQLGTVLAGDRPQQVWEYYLSPDGRNVAYTVQRNAGASVYVTSFRPLIDPRR